MAERSEGIGWIRLGLEFLPAADRRLVRARTFDAHDFATVAAENALLPDAARMRFSRAMLELVPLLAVAP